ncbi:MAG: alginate lyase family protein [Syntrophaceae bacterium]|nr:alginate lyase family protein [Syntrophaceae bacterium]
MSIGLFSRTLRTLRPEQVYYRLLYAARGRLKRSAVARTPTHAVQTATGFAPAVPFPSYPWFDAASVGAGRFRFLNETAVYGPVPEWHDARRSRLWRYNLHYFNYLLPPGGLPAETALPLLRRWVQDNPPGTADAWDPFPISLRLVNWIKYLCTSGAGGASVQDIVASLHGQALWLENSLEYHLLANHLFKNAKALLIAGLFFDGPDAARWRDMGIRLLAREISEQVLPDGGHFERSPMYHSMILEDCLDCYNLCAHRDGRDLQGLAVLLRDAVPKMAAFLRGMCHPDGQIALFNDAAFGIELPPEDLFAYQARLMGGQQEAFSAPACAFPESGYYVMAPSAGARLIVDCGPVGPDYQPGHAHCDTLSFEMSLRGRRVIVDSGCFGYEPGPMRAYNRGNAGHNTVTVDGRNQSEVWGAHRCGRRARPVRARLERMDDGALLFEGAHDGYAYLAGTPIHTRRIRWTADACLVEDEISGSGRHDIEARLHIHPDLSVTHSGLSVSVNDDAHEILAVSPLSDGRIELEDGWYCPAFGMKSPCRVLVQRFHGQPLPSRCGWRLQTAR